MKLPDYLKRRIKPQICDNCKFLSDSKRCLADINQRAFLDKDTMHTKARRSGKCYYFRKKLEKKL